MWIYDGSPEIVSAVVPDASAADGGYIMVFVLQSGAPRIVATRFPGKNVTSWKSRAARYGGETLARVLVSKPHPRYEKIKRLLTNQLALDEEGASTSTPLTLEFIDTKVSELFNALIPDGVRGRMRANDLSIEH